jgi:hypothetical protein
VLHRCGRLPCRHLRTPSAHPCVAPAPCPSPSAVIADEIYGNLVFTGHTFHPLASLSANVPILAAGGIAKEFLVPGWRVGWTIVHDRHGLFAGVRKGLMALSQLILGANSLIISALPAILAPQPGSADAESLARFQRDTIAQLERNAHYTASRLAAIRGISVVVPQGAMYVMFSYDKTVFPGLADEVALAQALLSEESVFVLPGSAFSMPGFCRIVFCAPMDKLRDAFDRMEAFCARHAVPADTASSTDAAAAVAENGSSSNGSSSQADGLKLKAAPPSPPSPSDPAAAEAVDVAEIKDMTARTLRSEQS